MLKFNCTQEEQEKVLHTVGTENNFFSLNFLNFDMSSDDEVFRMSWVDEVTGLDELEGRIEFPMEEEEVNDDFITFDDFVALCRRSDSHQVSRPNPTAIQQWQHHYHRQKQLWRQKRLLAHKRRAIQKATVIPRRIVKSDIRRQYSLMFANVLNSGDITMLMSFLDRYSASDQGVAMFKHCVVTDSSSSVTHDSLPSLSDAPTNATTPFSAALKSSKSSTSPSNAISLSGKEMIAGYWLGIMSCTPDHVIRLDRVRICQVATVRNSLLSHSSSNSGNGCRIDCDFHVRGMKLYRHINCARIAQNVLQQFEQYQYHLPMLTNINASPVPSCVSSSLLSDVKSSRRFPEVFYDPLQVCRDDCGSLPPPSPSAIDISGVLSIYIDEHKRIERIEMIGYHSLRVSC